MYGGGVYGSVASDTVLEVLRRRNTSSVLCTLKNPNIALQQTLEISTKNLEISRKNMEISRNYALLNAYRESRLG